MQDTTLISANGDLYTRRIPRVVITTFMNEVALENLRRQTCIDFKKDRFGNIQGQPQTWEQFARIFLAYDWLTHDQNNWDGNIMFLRGNHNTPMDSPLYYDKDGKRFIGVDIKRNDGKRTIKVDWDDDGANMPEEIAIPVYIPDEDVSDYLSDTYGFCVNSWHEIQP